MTKEEARAWRDRWKLVNEAEKHELRETSMDHKLRQVVVMMSAARELGWTEALREGEEEVRDRWNALRRKLCGKPAPGD
jgi:hypothetical protein